PKGVDIRSTVFAVTSSVSRRYICGVAVPHSFGFGTVMLCSTSVKPVGGMDCFNSCVPALALFPSNRCSRTVTSWAEPVLFSTFTATFTVALALLTSGVVTETPHFVMRILPVVSSHTCLYIPDPEYQRLFLPS